MSKNVKFNIKLSIDGRDVVVKASASAKELARAMSDVETKGNKARNVLIGFNQAAQSLQNITAGLQQLTSVLTTYTNAYNIQVQAETKLMTVMRERMAASEEDIRAIMRLTAAQQQLGVVGDEVQLMGAQQIATFATQRSTLEALIPAMNNLLVQQRGMNVTGQDAQQIGNLLGKALQGNVGALTRVGITLSDAQKQMIKYGDETQRASVIAQVITANVGDMNAQMAQTNAGKAQQLSNAMGDLKEQVGAVFAGFQPAILAVAEFTMAFNGLVTVGTTLAGLTRAIVALQAPTKVATALQIAYNWHIKEFAALSVAAAMGANKVKLALYALRAAAGPIAIATVAVVALVSAISRLSSSSSESAAKMKAHANATETLKSAEEAGAQASVNARIEMDNEIKKLGDLIKSKVIIGDGSQ